MLTRLRQLAHHLNHAKASTASRRTMTTVHNSNVACCTIPPVKIDYTPKGTFKSYGGYNKVYVTGPESSELAIVCVYDIFGFYPQTQQGADIIASELNAKLVMPDFFEPDAPWPNEAMPPRNEEEGKKLQEFFGGTAAPPKSVAGLKRVTEQLKSDGAKKVAAYGFCWGGKVCILAGGQGTPLDAVAAVHPAMLAVGDAENLSVPIALYPSKDEPKDEYEAMLKVVNAKPFASKNSSKLYSNMHHGWAAARANLNDAENKKEFEDVYSNLVTFIKNA